MGARNGESGDTIILLTREYVMQQETSADWFKEAEHYDRQLSGCRCLPGDPALMLYKREFEYALNRACQLEKEGK